MQQPSTGDRIATAETSLWYKDAIIYQLHVRAFRDSNGDGIGDFRGLTERLDYIQDLGVTAIWLLPFFPSPLKDDGYDIADYAQRQSAIRHAGRLPAVSRRSASPRAARHHRAGDESHVRPARVVPALAPRRARLALAQLVRVERHAGKVPGSADHLSGF